MIIKKYDTKEQWLAGRQCCITGSSLADIVVKRGTGKKMGFYQLIADRVAHNPDPDESAMDRGNRLEREAVEKLNEHTGLKFNQVDNEIWVSSDNDNIVISPDAYVKGKKITIAAETKCPNSAKYLMYRDIDEVPLEYELQVLQYFIVNTDLETLYLTLYDDRIVAAPIHIITVTRKELGLRIEHYLKYQLDTLAEVNKYVEKLVY